MQYAGPHPPRPCSCIANRIVYAMYVNSSGHYYEYIGSHTEQLHASNICTGRGGKVLMRKEVCKYVCMPCTYVIRSGKTGLITTITDIHFLPVGESCTHALPRNTKYLIIDGRVCFYGLLFTDAVKPRGCISWPWRASIGLQGVQNCSQLQSWPPLWIVSVYVTY